MIVVRRVVVRAVRRRGRVHDVCGLVEDARERAERGEDEKRGNERPRRRSLREAPRRHVALSI
jgi:hypothetical protein